MPVHDTVLIVGCTNRKRRPAEAGLSASDLPFGSFESLGHSWRERTLKAPRHLTAKDLYCGRGVSEPQKVAKNRPVDLRIASAGLGLVSLDSLVPAYNLTISRKSDEAIQRRVEGEVSSLTEWWAQVCSPVNPIASLVREYQGRVVILAMPSTYIELVAGDLGTLTNSELNAVRIISGSIPFELGRLSKCVLPYDHRLDGPDSPIRGTRTDFAVRAASHFIESCVGSGRTSLVVHRQRVIAALDKMRPPALHRRTRKSDVEIVDLILQRWSGAEGRSTHLLRAIRDFEQVACEQSRFRRLYQVAAEQRMA
jgi:hypothetical protein